MFSEAVLVCWICPADVLCCMLDPPQFKKDPRTGEIIGFFGVFDGEWLVLCLCAWEAKGLAMNCLLGLNPVVACRPRWAQRC